MSNDVAELKRIRAAKQQEFKDALAAAEAKREQAKAASAGDVLKAEIAELDASIASVKEDAGLTASRPAPANPPAPSAPAGASKE